MLLSHHFFDRAGVSLNAWPRGLGGYRGVVTATGVGRRGGTSRLRRVVHIVGVLVVAVDNRGEASQGIRSYSEVVEQVAVASAGDAALAHPTTMDFRSGLNLCEGAARLGRVLVLRHIYVPDGARWIVIWRVDTIVIGGAIPDDIEVSSAVGDAPGIDSCCRGGLVYLERSCPGRALIRGEAIVDVVIVAENGIDVASLVDAHVREIVIVADLCVGTVIHDVVGEGPNTQVSYNHNFTNVSIDKAGNVYSVFSDNHNIYYSFSTNQGTSWTGPFQVNKPPSATAIYPWSVANGAGHLDIVWYGTSYYDGVNPPDN